LKQVHLGVLGDTGDPGVELPVGPVARLQEFGGLLVLQKTPGLVDEELFDAARRRCLKDLPDVRTPLSCVVPAEMFQRACRSSSATG